LYEATNRRHRKTQAANGWHQSQKPNDDGSFLDIASLT